MLFITNLQCYNPQVQVSCMCCVIVLLVVRPSLDNKDVLLTDVGPGRALAILGWPLLALEFYLWMDGSCTLGFLFCAFNTD